MGKTKTLEILGSSNVGLYGHATDSYCLVGKNLNEEKIKTFETSLEVPIYPITIDGSVQIGIYLNGNNSCLLVPNVITESEIKALDELKIKYAIINTKETALGNNLIVGEKYFFYHPDMEESAVKEIKDALGLEGEVLEVEDWEVVGAICTVTSKGGLIQNDVPDEVKELVENKMGIEIEKGTLNYGSRTISGSLVVNCNGMVIGRASAGIEITNADMAFGFLEK